MKNPKTIACDRCGARIDHIPEKCPECGEIIYDRMDPHVRERIQEKMKKRQVSPGLIILGVVVLVTLAVIFVPSLIKNYYYPSGPSSAIGILSAVRSAQGMYQSKYNTYSTFGDLYNAGYLQKSIFNVGNGSVYEDGYTYTITVTSSAQWDCIEVPDDSNEPWVMVDETGTFSWSKDKGKTWTPIG